MLAYVFWHRPNRDIDTATYEAALLHFHRVLGESGCPGFHGSAAFRIGPVPWLGNKPGYADWYLIKASWAMDSLNDAAVTSRRQAAHDAVAAQAFDGHGGLYDLVSGTPDFRRDTRAIWLTRPRGIDYRPDLAAMTAGKSVSCWRRRMVLGPAPEFALTGSARLAVEPAAGWTRVAAVERVFLGP